MNFLLRSGRETAYNSCVLQDRRCPASNLGCGGIVVTRAVGVSEAKPLPPVMVNSCTGKMGHAAAEAIVAAGLHLVPYTFSGLSAGVAVANIGIRGTPVQIVGPQKRQEVMDEVRAQYPDLIIVDYTLPHCVNDNGAFYLENGVPFVMGTSGGDRDKLKALVSSRAAEGHGAHAVIAPQMGKQVAAFGAVVNMLGKSFPGAFAGYKLEVVESHQARKVDVSGTAREVVDALRAAGVSGSESDIVRVRDRLQQLDMGVPESALDGHAFHTYRLTSPDGSVSFVFKHNVVGRSIYAQGTVDAVHYLASVVASGAPPRLHDMSDVLKAGPLRRGAAPGMSAQTGEGNGSINYVFA